jgi:hypothetical protein
MSKLKTAVYGGLIAAWLGTGAAQVAPILDDPEGTTSTLKAQGFEPIEVGGGVWLGGSAGDFWRTKFTAENPKGDVVEGYATSGIFKGTTLRFD